MAALKNSYKWWSMKSSQIIFLFVLVFNVGCFQLTPKPQATEPEAPKSDSENLDGIVSETSSYHYQFSDINDGEICTTGKIDAVSLDEICKKLNDKEMNGSCAIDMRSELFYSYECPGAFTYPQAVPADASYDENVDVNVDGNLNENVDENVDVNLEVNPDISGEQIIEPIIEPNVAPIQIEAPSAQSEVIVGEDNVFYVSPIFIPLTK